MSHLPVLPEALGEARDVGAAEHVSTRTTKSIRRVESLVATVLRIGLAASSVVIVAGLAAQELALRRLPTGGLHSIAGPGRYPNSTPAALRGLSHGPGSALLEVGLGLLVCTPAAAIITAAVVYSRRGDRRIARVASLVLGVLAVSCLVGLLTH